MGRSGCSGCLGCLGLIFIVFLFFGCVGMMVDTSDESGVNDSETESSEHKSQSLKGKPGGKESVSKSNKGKSEENNKLKYESFIIDHSGRFSDKMFEVSTQFSNFELSDEWKNETYTIIGELDSQIDEVYNYGGVPVEYKDIHAEYLKAMDDYKKFTSEVPEAIDTLDINKMHELAYSMEQGEEHLKKTTELIYDKMNKN